MNTGRFLSFIEFLLAEEKSSSVQQALATLRDAINNLTNEPQNPQHQTAVAKSLASLKKKANSLATAMTPAQVDMLKEVEGGDMLGPSLPDWVSEWIAANAMTPAVARDEINSLAKRRAALIQTLEETKDRLTKLGVGPEEPVADEVELGFLIPRPLFENDFNSFRAELKFISQMVAMYSEAVTGGVEEITIGEISSSDPLLFLGVCVPTALAIAKTIQWLLDALKTSLEIRELLERGKAAGLSDVSLAGIAGEITAKLDQTIDERVRVIVANVQTEERKNELANGLTIMTKELLGRIERGLKVEVRLTQHSAEPASKEGEDGQDNSAAFAELSALSQQLVFPRLTGEALIRIDKGSEVD